MLDRSSIVKYYVGIMNKLSTDKRVQIVRCLVEGNSIRSTCRITGSAKNTVVKLLCDIGAACLEYQSEVLANLPCKRIQCDEIWSFVYSKAKNVPEGKEDSAGDVWTWTAICADTKLVPCWAVGNRDAETAYYFIHDLAARLANKVQLTTDGFKAYVNAIDEAFGSDIDFAQLVKIYGNLPVKNEQIRYSPGVCTGIRVAKHTGNPDANHVSTSFVERQNLTMRMGMRRFTRLTNAFSKKIENHEHAIALHFMHYNFCRIHQSLRVTPAMEAGVSDHVWELEEVIGLLDKKEKSN